MLTKLPFVLAALMLPASLWGQDQPILPRGHVFFATDFEESDALKGWTGPGVLGQGFQGGHALVLDCPAEKGRGYATATMRLPVEKMRGYIVQFSARVKAEEVSRKPQPWNGVKFMAPIVTDREKTWPAAEMDAGTFDWQRVAFRAIVPEDAKSISLVVGLEAVTGKAWFDDIRVVAWKPLALQGPPAAATLYKGHDLPRLRGAMVSPNIDAEGLRVLGQAWNANLVRWQLIRTETTFDPVDLAAYDRWLQAALKQLDAALPLCEKYGLRVVVDLHSPPGGRRLSGGYAGSDHGLFTDAACQRKFIEIWQHIAQRYKDVKAIWGYDLANEPVEAAAGEELADWQDLAERAATAIRAIDPRRTIIVEPPEWGNPNGLQELRPLPVPHVVYSVHMYLPHAFTHQGVHGPGKACRYPGEIEGKRWDKAQLEAALAPVVEFQRKYNVHIYIGEFSAIRWAPDGSACRYLKDLIDIFETHGWDWSYHAFREWDGWSVEHGNDPQDHHRAKTPTDREQLLRSWFAKNSKPSGQPTAAASLPAYRDGRPAAKLRLDAADHGVVLRHGDGPGRCDMLGARDVWVFEADGTYSMHYDAAGPKGWLAALATSKDLVHWQKKGPVLDLGKAGENDAASASYGTTFYDGRTWHMFYLGTPHTSPAPDRVPAFPYLTMKAKSVSPAGPWIKQKEIIPFQAKRGTYYSVTASPGQIVRQGDEYLMFFSAAVDHPTRRTLSIARTKNLDGPWTPDSEPILPASEQVENSSLYFEPTNGTWFLFTNHVGIDAFEYTDAVWVYWSKDLNHWDPAHKAVVLDRNNCTWSRHIIGLPSVVRVGDRLALFYDGSADAKMPQGVKSHMNRDIGLAWLRLPLEPPGDGR